MEKTLGQIGEDIACSYLRDKGFRILFRNYQKPWGEIDIVAQARDTTLVFVEVKTMTDKGESEIGPEDQMSTAKIKKFKLICETFVSHNPRLVNEKRGWRLDLVAIKGDFSNPAVKKEDLSITHYENVG